MKCLHCDRENVAAAKFCVGCGKPHVPQSRERQGSSVCSCGATLPPGAVFCTRCGLKQSPLPKEPGNPQVQLQLANKNSTVSLPGEAGSAPGQPPTQQIDLATSSPTLNPSLQDSTVAWRLESGVLVENVPAGRAANLCLARRLIVEPGTRMLIFRNGALAATLNSGHFELPTVQLEQIPGYQGRVRNIQSSGERWTGGVRQVASAVIGAAAEGARSFWNWCRESVIGIRERDLPPERRRQRATEQTGRGNGDPQRRPLLGDAIRWEPGFDVISAADVIHVVLARAGAFNLQFVFEGLAGVNGVTAERVGVEIEVELTDLRALFDRFVADRGVLTMEQLALDLTPFIRTRVAERIRGLKPSEIENNSEVLRALEADISEERRFNIDPEGNTLERPQLGVPGIAVRRVLHVTFSHKELERLERLRQELTLAREGLAVAREQADLQSLVDNESLRAELQSLRNVEERRKALREFHEITIRANNVILDRQGNAVSRDELVVHQDGRKIDVERRRIDAEIDRQVASMEMATRLEEARDQDKEEELMGEISERGLLRQESQDILREQLGQRRRLRMGQANQEEWMTEAGFNHDRAKVGLIQKQFLALLSIDQRNEQDEKQRDWDHRFRSQDAARKFELDRDALRRLGELRDLEQSQEISEATHQGSLESRKRDNTRKQLADEVGFEQLYADRELIRLRSFLQRRRSENEQAVDDAKTRGNISDIARGARVGDAEADIRLSGMRADLRHSEATREQELRHKDRQSQLDALKVAAEIQNRNAETEKNHAIRIKELDNERAIKLAEEETRKYAGKSFEQIMALNPNLNLEVAKAWAVVGSGKADAEAQKRIAEHAHELAKIERENAERAAQSSGQMMDRMERMFNTMAGVKEAQSSHLYAQQTAQTQHQSLHNAQLLQAEREKTQMAQDHTKQFVASVTEVTKTSFGAAAHTVSGVPTQAQTAGRRCPDPKCNTVNDAAAAFCLGCGTKLG